MKLLRTGLIIAVAAGSGLAVAATAAEPEPFSSNVPLDGYYHDQGSYVPSFPMARQQATSPTVTERRTEGAAPMAMPDNGRSMLPQQGYYLDEGGYVAAVPEEFR